MKASTGARAITAALVTIVLVALSGIALTGLCWDRMAASDVVANAGDAAGAIAYAALGTLIVRRTGNLVGWLMLAGAGSSAVMAVGSGYAIFGLAVHPGALPAPAVAGALAESAFVVVTTSLAAIFVVFPSGGCRRPAGARSRGPGWGWPG